MFAGPKDIRGPQRMRPKLFPTSHNRGARRESKSHHPFFRSLLDVGVTGSLALIYNFSFMTPNLKDGTPFSFTVPLQVNGVVTALGPNGFLQKLWTVDFTAKGTATFIGFASSGAITFDEANFSYSGTATVVPEPTTLLLSGSGMVAVYWRSRRKFRG